MNRSRALCQNHDNLANSALSCTPLRVVISATRSFAQLTGGLVLHEANEVPINFSKIFAKAFSEKLDAFFGR